MAYYSSEGTPIHSGAAGLGQDSGALMAFRDGSLGQDSGALMAFRDGSLGQDSGALMAFRDGSLGQDSGALMSFRDGSLGAPLFLHTARGRQRLPEPATITHGVRGCRGCGMGAVDTEGVIPKLNMKNPDVVLQVKGLMSLLAGDQLNAATPPGVFESGIWDQATTDFAGQWIVVVGSTEAKIPTNTFFVPPQLYPNATGIIAMVQLYAPALQTDEARADFERKFPDLVNFVSATQGDPSKGTVIAPYFEEPKADTRKYALLGLGAVALLGAAFMLRPKKRR